MNPGRRRMQRASMPACRRDSGDFGGDQAVEIDRGQSPGMATGAGTAGPGQRARVNQLLRRVHLAWAPHTNSAKRCSLGARAPQAARTTINSVSMVPSLVKLQGRRHPWSRIGAGRMTNIMRTSCTRVKQDPHPVRAFGRGPDAPARRAARRVRPGTARRSRGTGAPRWRRTGTARRRPARRRESGQIR